MSVVPTLVPVNIHQHVTATPAILRRTV